MTPSDHLYSHITYMTNIAEHKCLSDKQKIVQCQQGQAQPFALEKLDKAFRTLGIFVVK